MQRLMDTYLRVYDNMLEPAMCAVMIKKFEDAGTMFKKPGGVATQGASSEYHPDMKVSLDLCIGTTPGWEPVDKMLFQNLNQVLDRYFAEFPVDLRHYCSYDSDEGYRMRKYEKGIGKFDYHTDCSSLKIINRRLVVLWYLNDVEKGGETHFEYQNLKIEPRAGRVAVFPPFWMYKHAGLMPISNDKYIVRTFLTKSQ